MSSTLMWSTIRDKNRATETFVVECADCGIVAFCGNENATLPVLHNHPSIHKGK